MKSFKSQVVDEIILMLEDRLEAENKHLIKTDTIFNLCKGYIDLTDGMVEREELLEIGMRQVIQGGLYTHGYFSVQTGYFVNFSKCQNIWYLRQIINGKDDVITSKTAARNRLSELLDNAGQSTYIPGENNELILTEVKPKEEIIADLEADAI